MKNKKSMKKVFIVLLSCILTINLAFSSVYAQTGEKGSYSTKVVDGVKYTIHSFRENGMNHVEVFIGNNQDYYELYLSSDEDQLFQEEYDYKGKTFFGQKKYTKHTQVTDLSTSDEINSDVTAQGISYNSKTYECWSGDYWYKKGSDGTKVYYQIGCVATYQVRTDNNSNYKDILTLYANDIKSCNYDSIIGSAALVGTGVGTGVICAIIVANIICPATVIIDVVVAIFGGGVYVAAFTTAVVNLTKAYFHYLDVKDDYIDARACGVKIS